MQQHIKYALYIFRFVNLISQLLIVLECKTFPHTLRFATVKHADEAKKILCPQKI